MSYNFRCERKPIRTVRLFPPRSLRHTHCSTAPHTELHHSRTISADSMDTNSLTVFTVRNFTELTTTRLKLAGISSSTRRPFIHFFLLQGPPECYNYCNLYTIRVKFMIHKLHKLLTAQNFILALFAKLNTSR